MQKYGVEVSRECLVLCVMTSAVRSARNASRALSSLCVQLFFLSRSTPPYSSRAPRHPRTGLSRFWLVCALSLSLADRALFSRSLHCVMCVSPLLLLLLLLLFCECCAAASSDCDVGQAAAAAPAPAPAAAVKAIELRPHLVFCHGIRNTQNRQKQS